MVCPASRERQGRGDCNICVFSSSLRVCESIESNEGFPVPCVLLLLHPSLPSEREREREHLKA